MQLGTFLYAQISIYLDISRYSNAENSQQHLRRPSKLNTTVSLLTTDNFNTLRPLTGAPKTSTLYTHYQKPSRRFYFITHVRSPSYMLLGVI